MGDYDPSDPSSDSPEVTISPADNGHVVRWHQRGAKKDDPGRTVKRVAMTSDDALEHARSALSGTGKAKSSKKKFSRDGQLGSSAGPGSAAGTGDDSVSSPSAQPHASRMPARSARRSRPRVGGRR